MEAFNCLFVNVCNFTFSEESVVPIGQLSLASLINERISDARARVIDLNYAFGSKQLPRSDNLNNMITDSAHFLFKEIQPQLISLYTMCNTHHYAILLANEIKRIHPECTVCLAGPQASIVAKETLENYPLIDFIAIGEGELTIEGIIRGARTSDFRQCTGIAFRECGKVIVIPNEELIQNLDELPLLDYSLLNFKPHDIISIEVGRGCPFSCTFCTTNDFWKRKYRIKSPQRIFTELTFLYYEYGIKKFGFEHDLFLVNKQAVIELCKLITEADLKIKWGCSSRLDCIDEEILSIMAEAGCYSIFFGVETGSVTMQKAIHKNLNLSLIGPLILQLKKYNIAPTFSFIYGFPGEELSDIEDTLRLMYFLYEQYRVNFFAGDATVQLHKLMFLPGTPITNDSIDDLIPLSFLRTDVQSSETHWDDLCIVKMLENKKIFPQFYGLSNVEQTELAVLDVFFAAHLVHIIEYIDCTYKALLTHFNEHIKIFYSFIHIVGVDKLNSIQSNYDMTVGDVVEAHIQLFKEYIDHAFFGEDDELIHDIFGFEYVVYCQIHSSSTFEKIIDYAYDVITMKKTREIIKKKQKMQIKFIKSEKESRVIIGMKNN